MLLLFSSLTPHTICNIMEVYRTIDRVCGMNNSSIDQDGVGLAVKFRLTGATFDAHI